MNLRDTNRRHAALHWAAAIFLALSCTLLFGAPPDRNKSARTTSDTSTAESTSVTTDPVEAAAPLLPLIVSYDGAPARADQKRIEELGVPLPVLPDGSQPVARSGGYTYSIRSRATLPNGAWTELEATIRLGGAVNGRPFRIVRWKDS